MSTHAKGLNLTGMSSTNTQARIGHTRPRLYTLNEAAEVLGVGKGVLMNLVAKYGIKPTFNTKPKQYPIAPFQEALNKEKGMELKIEKGVPLPECHSFRAEVQKMCESMEVGDSFTVPLEDRNRFSVALRAAFPNRYFISRRDVEGGEVRFWRKA